MILSQKYVITFFYFIPYSEEAHWLLCDFRYCTLLFSQGASILCLVAISYDRLISILYPLRYSSIMTNIHFGLISSFIWLISSSNAILLPLIWNNTQTTTLKLHDISLCELIDSVSIFQFNFLVVPAAFICTLTIAVIYALIFKEAKKHFQKVQPISMSSCVASIGNGIELDHSETMNNHLQHSYPSSTRGTPTNSPDERQGYISDQAISHISIQVNRNLGPSSGGLEPKNNKLREKLNDEPINERKADQQSEEQNDEAMKERKTATKHAKAFVIVIGSFYICWLPFLILLALQTYGKIFSFTVFKIFELSCYPAIFNSGLNPIIYSIKMKQFRSVTKKLLQETFSS